MKLYTQIDLLKRIHFNIELKATGGPSSFARKLGISRRSLYRILEELEDREVRIVYSRKRGYFIYDDDHTILKLLKEWGGGKVKIF